MKKLLSLLLLCATIALKANSCALVNNSTKKINVHIKAKHKNKAHETRHDEAHYTFDPNQGAIFQFEGDIEIFNITDATSGTTIPALEVNHGLKDSQGNSKPKDTSTTLTDTAYSPKAKVKNIGVAYYLAISIQNNKFQTTWTQANTLANRVYPEPQIKYYDQKGNLLNSESFTFNSVGYPNDTLDTILILPAAASVAASHETAIAGQVQKNITNNMNLVSGKNYILMPSGASAMDIQSL